jgi:hypothetical protein
MEIKLTELETYMLFLAFMVVVLYYVDIIGAVLKKEITKRRLVISLIPIMGWIIILITSINQLED